VRLRILSVLVVLTVATACSQGAVTGPSVPAPSEATLDTIAQVVRAEDPTARSTPADISLHGPADGTENIRPIQARQWTGNDNEVSVIVESFATRDDADRFNRAHNRANLQTYDSVAPIAPPVSGATAFTCGCGGDTIVAFLRGNTRVFIEVETPITNREAVADRLAREIDHLLRTGTRADARV
jgi:hypothetical protein